MRTRGSIEELFCAMTFCNGYRAEQQALDQPPHRRRARQMILRPPFTMAGPASMMRLPSEKQSCRRQVNRRKNKVMAKKSKAKKSAPKRPVAKKKKK